MMRSRFRIAISVGLLAALPKAAFSGKCVPPVFYQSVPRDVDWYYGVGKDADTDRARDLALINLGKQVTGSLQGADQASIGEIAGQGVDRTKAAEMVGQLLPSSTLLAGWEQDDHDRCNGISYVLVRIEKEKVQRFIQEDKKFKEDVVRGVNSRVDELKESVASLISRLDTLEQQNRKALEELQTIKAGSAQADSTGTRSQKVRSYQQLGKAIKVVRVQLRSGEQASAHAVVALDSLEREFNEIRRSVEGSKVMHSEAQNRAIERARAGIVDGSLNMKDFNAASTAYMSRVTGRPFDDPSWQDLEDFNVSVARMKRTGIWGYLNRDFDKVREQGIGSFVFGGAVQRKRWDLIIEFSQDYMKNYPTGNYFSIMEQNLNDAMKNKRNEAGARR